MKEYEKKLNLEEIRQMNKLFSLFSTCQEFIDYLRALIDNNKLLIKKITEDQMCIELMVEYLFKQYIIKIDLSKKKANFELIAQDLYEKYNYLSGNFKNLENNYEKIVQENNSIKDEIKKIKEVLKMQKII